MYRLAAFWAALAAPVWVALIWWWPELLPAPDALRTIHWHARAMVSGFVAAVIVGFLIAPLRRWPQERSALGWSMAMIWMVARVLSLLPAPYADAAAIADLAFLLIAAAFLGARAWRAPSSFNLLFAAAPFVLMVAIVMPLQVLWLVSCLIALLAGRIIPGAVNARLAGRPARVRSDVDRAALLALLIAVMLRLVWRESAAADLAAVLAALLHLLRWWGWAPLQVIRSDARLAPMVIAYAWLPLWLLLEAAEGLLPMGLASHALAVGLVGGMIWAMVNRALVGASIEIGIVERIGLAAIVTAPFLRLAVGLADPRWYGTLLGLAAVCWSLAFISLAVRTGSAVRVAPEAARRGHRLTSR